MFYSYMWCTISRAKGTNLGNNEIDSISAGIKKPNLLILQKQILHLFNNFSIGFH